MVEAAESEYSGVLKTSNLLIFGTSKTQKTAKFRLTGPRPRILIDIHLAAIEVSLGKSFTNIHRAIIRHSGNHLFTS
jgi:hypothetical protein